MLDYRIFFLSVIDSLYKILLYGSHTFWPHYPHNRTGIHHQPTAKHRPLSSRSDLSISDSSTIIHLSKQRIFIPIGFSLTTCQSANNERFANPEISEHNDSNIDSSIASKYKFEYKSGHQSTN